MKELFIDIETFSSIELVKSSVYRYVEAKDFEILLFGYSVDKGPIKVIDLASGEKIPAEIIKAIKDENVLKIAHNATFERICCSRFLGMPTGSYLLPKSWYCTMVHAATLAFPLSLENVGTILKLKDQKLKEGKDLIRYFCKPCAPSKSNGFRTRNYFYHDKEKWERFKAYNNRDVEAEIEVYNKLGKFPVLPSIWEEYALESRVNDNGVMVDLVLVDNAIKLDGIVKGELMERMKKLTALENPNSVAQLKKFLHDNGIITDDLGKKSVIKLIENAPSEIKEILILRQQISKSSIKKYQAIRNCVCDDNRVRGMFQFYGASRTGRESGRLIQLQNIPQNHIKNLDEVRGLLRNGEFEKIKAMFDDVPQVLSELIRTAFISKPGYKFIDCDFSAIEARVLAYLSKEEWRINAFKNKEDIYCASASKMFGVPVVKGGINGELRPKGKIAELALGYGGSVGALTAMGALEMGLKEEELQPLVYAWRNANHNITNFWWTLGNSIRNTLVSKQENTCFGLTTYYEGGILFIKLPSGRSLSYPLPNITLDEYGKENITYYGETSSHVWSPIDSYGPKFCENVCQAVARDILFFAMKNVDKLGIDIVMTIHDEVVCEVKDGTYTVEDIEKVMRETPAWAEGLILNAEGFEARYFKKE